MMTLLFVIALCLALVPWFVIALFFWRLYHTNYYKDQEDHIKEVRKRYTRN